MSQLQLLAVAEADLLVEVLVLVEVLEAFYSVAEV
jgi:hypothetical protein